MTELIGPDSLELLGNTLVNLIAEKSVYISDIDFKKLTGDEITEFGTEGRAIHAAQPLRLHYFGREPPGVTDVRDQIPDLVRRRRHVNCRRTFHGLIQTQVRAWS